MLPPLKDNRLPGLWSIPDGHCPQGRKFRFALKLIHLGQEPPVFASFGLVELRESLLPIKVEGVGRPLVVLDLFRRIIMRGICPLKKLSAKRPIAGRVLRGGNHGQFSLRNLLRAIEHTVEAIVILHGERVTLVIMATHTLHGEPHRAPERDINPIRNDEVMLVQVAASQSKKAQGGLLSHWHIHQVSRNLPPEKLIIRQVLIQSLYDPIPIGERKGEEASGCKIVALGIRIASNVQPVARPALPIVRRRQGLINHASTPFWQRLLRCPRDLSAESRRRLEASDHMPCPAQEHLAGGIRHRFKVFLPLANSQKLIHRVALSRKRRTGRHLKGPMLLRGCSAGPRGANHQRKHRDPGKEQGKNSHTNWVSQKCARRAAFPQGQVAQLGTQKDRLNESINP